MGDIIYPYNREINGQDVTITGPISVITVDNVNYDIKDNAAWEAIDGLQNDLADALSSPSDSPFKTALQNAVIDMLYPVGALYITTNNTPPSHGQWELYGKGKAIVGVNPGVAPASSAGAMFGAPDAVVPTHKHTINSNGAHTHSIASHTHGFGSGRKVATFTGTGSVDAKGWLSDGSYEMIQITGSSGQWHTNQTTTAGSGALTTGSTGAHNHSCDTTGSSATNANYQPSIAVYIWKRVE